MLSNCSSPLKQPQQLVTGLLEFNAELDDHPLAAHHVEKIISKLSRPVNYAHDSESSQAHIAPPLYESAIRVSRQEVVCPPDISHAVRENVCVMPELNLNFYEAFSIFSLRQPLF